MVKKAYGLFSSVRLLSTAVQHISNTKFGVIGSWSHCYRKNGIKLEIVRTRFTKMLPGLERFKLYKEMLDLLGLFFPGLEEAE